MVLVYGEEKTSKELRELFHLSKKDVFIAGNCNSSEADGYYPFAAQYINSCSKQYVPCSLLATTFSPNLEPLWKDREFLVGFLSQRPGARDRMFRCKFVTALSAKLESVDFEGEKGEQVRALGTNQPESTTDCSKWFKTIEAGEEAKGLDYFDKALFPK